MKNKAEAIKDLTDALRAMLMWACTIHPEEPKNSDAWGCSAYERAREALRKWDKE